MMNFKRPLEGDPSIRVQKRRSLRNASFSLEDLVNRMEPLIRRVIQEEFDRISQIYLGSSSRILNHPIQSNGETGLTLQFVTNLPATLFTGNKIHADDNSRVLIELTDSRSGTRVTTGPLSSLKIDIVVLEGDFDPDQSKFNDKIAVERQGRRPLLNGDLTVTLTQGLGCLENVTFTDNSSWVRCGKFKLGARVSSKSRVVEPIREASSRAVIVKDHRGKQYEKHHPPYPNDEVWRLEQIGKGGKYNLRLASRGIRTVKEFRRLQETDPSLLKKILSGDGTKISNKTWEAIIGHAAECKFDDNEMYVYPSPESTNPSLFYGAAFDGREYCPVEKLNVPKTNLVQNLKGEAFENVNQFIPARGTATTDLSKPQQEFGSSSTSTSFCYEASGSQCSEPQSYHNEDVLPPTLDNILSQFLQGVGSFSPPTIFEDENGPQFHISSNLHATSPLMPNNFNGMFFGETEFGNFTCSPSNWMWPSNEAGSSFNVCIHRTARSRAAWCKIRAAIKFRFVRRDLTARRNLVATRHQVFWM